MTLKNYVNRDKMMRLEDFIQYAQKYFEGKCRMGKNVKYPPLQIVQYTEPLVRQIEQWRIENPSPQVEREICQATNFTSDFVMRKHYGKRGKPMNAQAVAKLEYEIYDCTIAALIATTWKYNKQVYRFSREFYDMLQEVGDFKIGWSLFEYLPYKSFYLEVEDHEKIEGVMVRYMPGGKQDSAALIFTICSKTDSSNRNISAVASPEKYDDYERYFRREVFRNKANLAAEQVVLMKEVLAFVFQACMYLCAKNVQLEENSEQKRIYKPSKAIHNKLSEVQKWDVGMRITRDLKAVKSQRVDNTPKVAGSITGRKRPRQHWRKAHWHSFWVGPRSNRRKVVHFIAPILVNDIGDDIPVVIHN